MPEPVAGQPPPTTTIQQEITLAGQRRVNLIWEYTQAIISLLVVSANMIVGTVYALTKDHGEYPTVLSNTLFLVIGFYYSRTNHAAIGGVGAKPIEAYTGR